MSIEKSMRKGGAKTPEGKLASSRNAIKHGILSHSVFEDEAGIYADLVEEISNTRAADSVLKNILFERIAVHVLQLRRISHARNEFIRAELEPGKVVDRLNIDFDSFVEVIEEPYKPELDPHTIEKLFSLYHRYEISTENRMYRGIKELKKLS